MARGTLVRWSAGALIATVFGAAAAAQTPAEFYKGKNVEIQVNVSVGGGYDLYARMLARHLGHHIPGNPTVIVGNMPGGGGMRLANWLYNVAPKDGTALGAATRAMAFEPLLGQQGRPIRRPGVQLHRQRQ